MTSALANRVLVLNKGWKAVDVCTAKSAVCKVYQGIAKIVQPVTYNTFDFDGWMDFSIGSWAEAKETAQWIQGIGFQMQVPEIIVLQTYSGFKVKEAKFSRRNIFERDRHTCQYCGKHLPTKELTIDHVLPKSRGGKSIWTNVALACYDCNKRKDDRTPEEAHMRLKRKPHRPQWAEVKKLVAGSVPKSWEAFLSEMYWNVKLKS